MKRSTALVSFFGALLVIAIVLWIGFTRAWKDFGTVRGGRYIHHYTLPASKASIEARIYDLVKRNPRSYSLDPDSSFDNDNWVTLRFADDADSFYCVFKFEGDSTQWKQQDSSTIALFTIDADGKDIQYISQKNGDLHDTANLHRVFERMVLDSLRHAKAKDRSKQR
ncbi:MAG TPA: hypothetical protein VHM26_11620 [Chitinophagaceae bacterium]|jgi:hypothetical protein|nr:hypothetical protein [Chitinophagaceae bacterium]